MMYWLVRIALATAVVYAIIGLFFLLTKVLGMVLAIVGAVLIGAAMAWGDEKRLERQYRETMDKE